MATIFVQLSSLSTTPGPFNIYADTTNSVPIETNVDAQTLKQSRTYDIVPAPTKIIIVNANPACNSKTLELPVSNIPTPTPTQTLTATPNASPSPTSTQTPTTPHRSTRPP